MSMTSHGDVLDGRFRLEALTGIGGMGSVHRGWDLEEERPCAVKLLRADHKDDPFAIARVRTEVATLSALSHEAVVRYYASGHAAEGPYLVMEWVDGETVRDRVAREGIPVADALAIAARLTRALARVHDAGIVHRDVTPRNVMLEGCDLARAKLVDFGIARIAATPGLTGTGVRLGTPRYMAPEQILNARRVDGRADVFSLGCVLFEMLAGRRSFEGEDEVALLARVLIEDAPRVTSLRKELPREIDVLVARMLARDPRARPRADDALVQEIEHAARLAAPLALPGIVVSARRAPQVTEADSTAPPRPSHLSMATRRSNVPSIAAPLVGRDRELADLRAALVPGALVSLWGGIGVGKSRLLFTLASQLSLEREVAYVDLHAALDLDAVFERIADALGVEAADQTRIGRVVARTPTLLVLDSADAVLGVIGAPIRAWREGAKSLSIVVGARGRFESGATSFELKPLDAAATQELLRRRLRERGHDMDSASESLRTSVVPRLEGNPLMIELAAARFDLLGAEGLATRLASPIEAFEGTRAPEYRFTLEEALESSWSALDEPAQRALAFLSAFAGPVDLDVAERLLRAAGVASATGVLQRLRDRSLLTRTHEGRFTLSEAVRDLAARKRASLGLEREARTAHAATVLERGEALARDVASTGSREARLLLAGLEQELEAIVDRFASEPGAASRALRALLACDPMLVARVPLASRLDRLTKMAAAAEREHAPDELLVRALQARGRLLAMRGRADEARPLLEHAVSAARAAGDAEREASSLLDLGVAVHGAGDLAKAEECYEAVLALRINFENPVVEARALGNLGAIAHDRHRLDWAYRRYVEAIALVETSGDRRLLGVFLGNLAVLDRERGDLVLAQRRFSRAMEVLDAIGDVRLTAVACGNLGMLYLEKEDLDAALECFTRARSMLERFGDVHSEAIAMARQTIALALLGRVEDARKSLFLGGRVARGLAAELMSIAEGFVEAAEGALDAARERCRAAQTAGADGRAPVVDRSDDARLLVRLLTRRY